jgi:hypothetical protein
MRRLERRVSHWYRLPCERDEHGRIAGCGRQRDARRRIADAGCEPNAARVQLALRLGTRRLVVEVYMSRRPRARLVRDGKRRERNVSE